MKILFVAPFGLGQKTTVWARVLPLAKEVHRATDLPHNITILVPPWDTPQDSGRSWTDEGITIKHVSLSCGLPCIIWQLMRAIHQEQPDIIHICKPRAYAGLIQWLQWTLRKFRPTFLTEGREYKPRILLDIDDWEQSWNEINAHSEWMSRFLAWQEEWGIRHADGITAASRWLVQRAQTYAPKTPVLYLPNGVTEPEFIASTDVKADQTKAPSLIEESPCQILYLTRYVEVSPEWLADFWFELEMRIRETQQPNEQASGGWTFIELIIAGGPIQTGRDDLFRQEFEARLQHNRYSKSKKTTVPDSPSGHTKLDVAGIRWLGYIEPELISQLYATSTCAIFPATPVPLQEAKCSVRLATTLLHGVPVVASAVGQQAEYGANGAAKLVPADAQPELFAAELYKVLASQHSRKEISKRARAHLLSNFHWEKLGTSLARFYSSL